MLYKAIDPVTKASDELARDRTDPDLHRIVLAVALHEPDVDWAERYCLGLATSTDPTVRGNAMLAFGHLTLRFGRVPAAALPLIAAALNDDDPYVRGQADSAADDIDSFTHKSVGAER